MPTATGKSIFNIYCYENKIDGKVYIGQTKKSLDERCGANATGYRKCVKLYSAIQKYGLNNFDRWIFKIVDDQKEADQDEIFWIDEMRIQLGKKNVYNIREGGSNGWQGHKHSEESLKKMSELKTGKIMTDEAKKKISVANKGKKLTEGHKTKLSVAAQGRDMSKVIAARTNPPRTPETKAKLSAHWKGRTWKLIDGKRVWSDK
jgi:group I intron endonuclease